MRACKHSLRAHCVPPHNPFTPALTVRSVRRGGWWRCPPAGSQVLRGLLCAPPPAALPLRPRASRPGTHAPHVLHWLLQACLMLAAPGVGICTEWADLCSTLPTALPRALPGFVPLQGCCWVCKGSNCLGTCQCGVPLATTSTRGGGRVIGRWGWDRDKDLVSAHRHGNCFVGHSYLIRQGTAASAGQPQQLQMAVRDPVKEMKRKAYASSDRYRL